MTVRVLLSGGLDSAACLVWALHKWALDEFDTVDAVGFDYGQPHRKELAAAVRVANALSADYWTERLVLSGGLLDGGTEGAATVVPDRNAAFLRAAAPGASALVLGCTAEDQEHYPDCRPEFVEAMTAELGIPVHAPLITKTKAEVWAMVPPEVRRLTWSCYVGGQELCGVCGACRVRALAVPCPTCFTGGRPTPTGARCHHPSAGYCAPHRARVEASCR